MNLRRAVSVLLAATAATMLVTGSFGFTGVSADRGVAVSVAEDSEAYVDYRTSDRTVEDGGTVELVTIGNLFGSEVGVESVSIESGSFTVHESSSFDTIGSGEYETIHGSVDCEPGTNATVGVTVELSGNGVSAEIGGETREFELACTQPTATGSIDEAEFNGTGNVEFEATNVGTTEIVYWTTTGKADPGNDEYERRGRSEFDTDGKLRATGPSKIVAVYFPEYDVSFVHPSYHDGNWGAGDGIKVCGEYDPDNGGPDEAEEDCGDGEED